MALKLLVLIVLGAFAVACAGIAVYLAVVAAIVGLYHLVFRCLRQ